jgi:anthranilate/para-aminobenzoate synthase component I
MSIYGTPNYGAYPYQQNGAYGYTGYSAPMYQQTAPQPSVQPQTVNTNKMYATGLEDVRCRQLPVNSDYIFLDNDKPLIYRKTTDATGKMNIEVFKIVPYQEEEKPKQEIDLSNYVSREDFRRLEQQFDELRESINKGESAKATPKKTV